MQNGESGKFDTLLWLLAIALLAAGLVANFYVTGLAGAVKAIAWIVLFALIGTVLAYTAKGKMAINFANAARVEMRKVVWPTRPETIRTTFIVIVLVVIVAALLWLIDTGLIVLIGWLTGTRG